jgi:hypothetical protein
MRCKNCGWDNPEGIYKCEKCNACVQDRPGTLKCFPKFEIAQIFDGGGAFKCLRDPIDPMVFVDIAIVNDNMINNALNWGELSHEKKMVLIEARVHFLSAIVNIEHNIERRASYVWQSEFDTIIREQYRFINVIRQVLPAGMCGNTKICDIIYDKLIDEEYERLYEMP